MFAGLIVAGVVWVDYSLRDSISRLVLIYIAFLAIPFGNLYHVVVSATEMFYLVFIGELALSVGLWQFVLPVLLGNSVGGVVLVTVVNYFHTTERRLETARDQGPSASSPSGSGSGAGGPLRAARTCRRPTKFPKAIRSRERTSADTNHFNGLRLSLV